MFALRRPVLRECPRCRGDPEITGYVTGFDEGMGGEEGGVMTLWGGMPDSIDASEMSFYMTNGTILGFR